MLKKIIAVSLLSLSSLAMAEGGFYLGASAGRTSVDLDTTGTTSSDETDTGFKVFAGYAFNKNFAIEGGYADLGNALLGDNTLPIFAEFNSSAWFLDLLGSVPLNNDFSLFARAGIAGTNVEVTGTIPGLGSASFEEDVTVFKFGVGAQYAFTQNLVARAEWERYRDVEAPIGLGKSDIDVVSAGLQYHF